MVMSAEERAYLQARNLLAEHKNKEKAARELSFKGMGKERAIALVDQVFADNLRENRKYAVPKMVGSGLMFLVLLGVFLSTGRLYLIWLPVCAVGFLWGLANIVLTDGFEIPTDLDSSD
jgi:hypothetical protein